MLGFRERCDCISELMDRVRTLENEVAVLKQEKQTLNELIDNRLNVIEQNLEGQIVEKFYVKELSKPHLYKLIELFEKGEEC